MTTHARPRLAASRAVWMMSCAVIAGCAADPTSETDLPAQAGDDAARTHRTYERITALDLRSLGAGEQLEVDVSDISRVYVLDAVDGPIAIDRILLLCPNHVTMSMDAWVASTTALLPELQVVDALADARLWLTMAIDALDPIRGACMQCDRCPDGVWLCTDECTREPPLMREPTTSEEKSAVSWPYPDRPPPPSPSDPSSWGGGSSAPSSGGAPTTTGSPDPPPDSW